MQKRRSDSAADERLSAALDNVSDAFFALDPSWRVTLFNSAAEEFFGTARGDVLGREFWSLYGLGRETRYARALLRAMDKRQATRFTQPSAMRAGRMVEVRIGPQPDGSIGVSTHDITERTKAEEAALLNQQRLDLAVEAHRMGVFDWDPANGHAVWSAELAALFGLDSGVLAGPMDMIRAMMPDDDLARIDASMQAAMDAGAPTASYEYRIRRPDGAVRWLEGAARFLYGAKGKAVRIVGTNIDITERKTAEAHQRLLLNELNHRVKNTLATVQAMARQSLRSVDPAAWEAFEGRLAALSAAHNVLTQRNWEAASIPQIVEVATAAYDSGGRRVSAEGPAINLEPKTTVALALAMHELATNAVKYGALSTPMGQVDVRWSQADARLRLTWTETGGPSVRAPERLGFGARLLERGLAEELRGTVRLDFRPEGLVCTVEASLAMGTSEPSALG